MRLRDPKPEDVTLPAETDGYLRHHPEDAEIREAARGCPSWTRASSPALLHRTSSMQGKEKEMAKVVLFSRYDRLQVGFQEDYLATIR